MAFSIMGQNAATWKPVEGKHASIFGMHDRVGTSEDASSGNMLLNADLAAATNALRNVTITKATLLQCHNNFGVPLGVTINCLPKNEVIDTGDRQGQMQMASLRNAVAQAVTQACACVQIHFYHHPQHLHQHPLHPLRGRRIPPAGHGVAQDLWQVHCLQPCQTGCAGGSQLLLPLCTREPPGCQSAQDQQAHCGRRH